MFKSLIRRQPKVAEGQELQSQKTIVHVADKLPASEINTLMSAIKLEKFANFR